MKKANKAILFFLVLILVLLLSYNIIESAQWNVKESGDKVDAVKKVDVNRSKETLYLDQRHRHNPELTKQRSREE